MKLQNKMSHKFSKEISFISLPGYHTYSGIQENWRRKISRKYFWQIHGSLNSLVINRFRSFVCECSLVLFFERLPSLLVPQGVDNWIQQM